MNDLATQPSMQSTGYSPASELTVELAKMLALVAPTSMSAEQQELWLRAAVDSLQDIRPAEVRDVSVEIRRSVTRPSQIVPEIARLVAERRSRNRRIDEIARLPEGPPPKRPVMDRRGQPMSAEETDELNGILERLGAKARYRPDGSRYEAAA